MTGAGAPRPPAPPRRRLVVRLAATTKAARMLRAGLLPELGREAPWVDVLLVTVPSADEALRLVDDDHVDLAVTGVVPGGPDRVVRARTRYGAGDWWYVVSRSRVDARVQEALRELARASAGTRAALRTNHPCSHGPRRA